METAAVVFSMPSGCGSDTKRDSSWNSPGAKKRKLNGIPKKLQLHLFPERNGNAKDRAIVQAVGRRPPTASTRVRVQVRLCRIYSGQSDTGAGFIRVLRFPLPILISPTAPRLSSYIICGWYSRPISGRRTTWTQPHPAPRN
jgi:hypothetical protein